MIDLKAGEQYSPEYRSLNRNSIIPTLIHDNEVLIESSVIIYYQEEVFQDLILMPDSHLERTKVRLWLQELDISDNKLVDLSMHFVGNPKQCAKFKHSCSSGSLWYLASYH